MKGEILFEKMTGISEEYITEAALVPALGAQPAPRRESRFAALSNALNSGWGVACICFIVAFATVVGMVAWGRMGEPVGPGYLPSDQSQFSFRCSSVMSTFPYPGSTFVLTTSVTNEGAPFTYEGSSMGFAPNAVLIHAETGYRIEGDFPTTKDHVTFTVNTGETGRCDQIFSVPANAPTGRYHLVLSFRDAEQRFDNYLSISHRNTGETLADTVPPPIPPNPDSPFTFGCDPLGITVSTNDILHLNTWVRNDGEPFTFEGSSMGYAPDAVLVHMETGYRIPGSLDVTDDEVQFTVNTGDVGRRTSEFFIPADAPAGNYQLELSFNGESTTFKRAVSVVDPHRAYKLTMRGSAFDWLYEPLQESYMAGETVTVRIKFATDVGTLFILSGGFIPDSAGDEQMILSAEIIPVSAGDEQMGYWEYTFTMPARDSTILFHTYDGTAPYARMLEACILRDPYTFREEQFYYYGEFGNGVMVALQLGYGEAMWATTVGGYTFVTHNTHDMLAFCNGTLYSLQEAYEMGLLTDADLEAMQILHHEWFPYVPYSR